MSKSKVFKIKARFADDEERLFLPVEPIPFRMGDGKEFARSDGCEWNQKSVLRAFFVCTLIVVFECIAYSVRSGIFVALIGVGLGVVITPVLDFLHTRFKTPRILNAVVFIVSTLTFAGVTGFFLFDLLADQVSAAMAKEPQILAKATARVAEFFGRYPWVPHQIAQLNIGSRLPNIAQQFAHGLWLGGTLVAGIIVSIVIGIYIAMNPSFYVDGALSLVPGTRREDVHQLLQEIAVSLRKWLGAQLLAMLIVGLATTLILRLIGVDYWLLFGVLAGLLDVVPYLGPIIPLAALIVVNLANDPEKIPWIVGAFILIHQFENNVSVPLIFRYRMKFPPAILIATMLITGKLFGVIGLILTPAFFSVFQTIFIHYKKLPNNALMIGQQLKTEVSP